MNYSSLSRPDPYIQYVSLEDGDLQVEFHLQIQTKFYFYLYHFMGLLSGGLLYLICFWSPLIYIRLFTVHVHNALTLTSSSESDEQESDSVSFPLYLVNDLQVLTSIHTVYIYATNNWNQQDIIKLNVIAFDGFIANALPFSLSHSFFLKKLQIFNYKLDAVLSFEYRSTRYLFDPLDFKFVPTTLFKDWNWIDKSMDFDPLQPLLDNTIGDGLSSQFAFERHLIFGENALTIPDPTTWQLMLHEILHPFYIFQLFSIGVWLMENYYFYAFCIFLISILSSVQNLFDTKTSYKRLHSFIVNCNVSVLRDNKWILIDSTQLVSGDVYKVINQVPCDSLLLTGHCIVNESALTGESIPVSKFQIESTKIKHFLNAFKIDSATFPNQFTKNVLYNGTTIINPQGIALCLRTGFNTTKGQLVRSMLHPKPHTFKFYQDSYKFIAVMAAVAFIGFIYTSINFINRGESAFIIFLRGLDLITITVPPALPATMSVGVSFALKRLKRMQIFCIAPSRINVAGQLNLLLFDKTGTLTVDGLVLLGVQPVIQSEFVTAVVEKVKDLKNNHLLTCMATCHSIVKYNGQLMGDTLEVEMFKFTKAQLSDNAILLKNEKITVLVNHPFDPVLKCQTVLIENKGKQFIYCKGAPEVLKEKCLASSIPKDFNELLSQCSHVGFRVLACAYKDNTDSIEREDMEQNLQFLGFLIFENKLKAKTTRTIETLNSARIAMGMCTGDNLLTAISIGRECGLLAPSPELIHDIRKKSIVIQDIVYANLFPQEEGFVNMNDELMLSGSFSQSLRRESLIVPPQQSGFSSESDSSIMSPLESPIDAGFSNFLLFVPFILQSDEIQWRCLDVPLLVLDINLEIQVKTYDVSIFSSSNYFYSKGFLANLEKQHGYILNNMHLLEDIQVCYAMDGSSYELICNYPNKPLVDAILSNCKIFARMSPDQKQDLVERMQQLEYTVGFIGDGANDCGALKASDVGLSLSDAEASIAAPFTSKYFEIDCVVSLMREGRAALVTSFSCFKYMALYSFIQFISVTMLYNVGSNLGDLQFLYIDLFLILPLAITMAYSGPFRYLFYKKPTANLLSGKVMTSIFGQVIIQMAFQIGINLLVKQQSFYTLPNTNPETEEIACYENTVLFIVSSFQYIILACIYSIGPPYRAPLSKNIYFIATAMFMILLTVLTTMAVFKQLNSAMELLDMPFYFKLLLIVYCAVNYLTSYFSEKILFPLVLSKFN